MSIKGYDPSKYEKLSVAVDLLVFTIDDDRLKVLMIEREEEPYKNMLALPGVFVKIDETLEAAVARGIAEETGLKNVYFEQLYTFGEVERDPRMRIVSVAYMALVPVRLMDFNAGKRAVSVGLEDVEELLASDKEIAFDHKDIIECARKRLAGKVEYTDIAFNFVDDMFTLPQLQRIYEILLGKKLYKANFRKKIMPSIAETEYQTTGDAHRPSRMYKKKEE